MICRTATDVPVTIFPRADGKAVEYDAPLTLRNAKVDWPGFFSSVLKNSPNLRNRRFRKTFSPQKPGRLSAPSPHGRIYRTGLSILTSLFGYEAFGNPWIVPFCEESSNRCDPPSVRRVNISEVDQTLFKCTRCPSTDDIINIRV
jgi:hypothetical protein